MPYNATYVGCSLGFRTELKSSYSVISVKNQMDPSNYCSYNIFFR